MTGIRKLSLYLLAGDFQHGLAPPLWVHLRTTYPFSPTHSYFCALMQTWTWIITRERMTYQNLFFPHIKLFGDTSFYPSIISRSWTYTTMSTANLLCSSIPFFIVIQLLAVPSNHIYSWALSPNLCQFLGSLNLCPFPEKTKYLPLSTSSICLDSITYDHLVTCLWNGSIDSSPASMMRSWHWSLNTLISLGIRHLDEWIWSDGLWTPKHTVMNYIHWQNRISHPWHVKFHTLRSDFQWDCSGPKWICA
jgi:hypothetical protein